MRSEKEGGSAGQTDRRTKWRLDGAGGKQVGRRRGPGGLEKRGREVNIRASEGIISKFEGTS